ncbi:MAG: pyrroline-5-carboxylate reductase [Bacteroidaceae bacterium]|nr:pyrroline-5-carboxylate reductase [Bacteroidaceae bacterium]
MKITVIGAGNMGGALAKGWAKAAQSGQAGKVLASVSDICVADKAQATLQKFAADFPGIRTTDDNACAVEGADIVVLAVKPWLVEVVVNDIREQIDFKNQIVVSIAAGITTDKLIGFFGNVPADANIFYCIPNIAAEFAQSMTFISSTKGTSKEAVEKVDQLFKIDGDTLITEERLVGPGMMMASCGIAYVFRFLRAMTEGGVEMGFYPQQALQIAMQTMEGAVSLLRETGLHPEAAIDKVTTPGGTTIKGLNELDHAGFNSAVIRCLKAGLK